MLFSLLKLEAYLRSIAEQFNNFIKHKMKTFLIKLSLKTKMYAIKYVIFVALLSLWINSAFAQSFIDTTKIWSIVSMDTGGGPYQGNLTTSQFKFDGDTIINLETYHILHSSFDANPQNWRANSFWKEKNDSVFQFNTTIESEELIYDFTLNENDSFHVDEFLTLKVDSVRSKEWGGRLRKHWYFHDLSGNPISNTVWIEGVGNTNNFTISSDIYIVGAISWLLCFTENDELVYQNPEYNSCYVVTSVPTFKKEPELVEVYSASENLVTVNPLTGNLGIIQIYNITGNQIIQEEIELEKRQICLPSTGAYIYRFIAKTGEMQNGKIVVR